MKFSISTDSPAKKNKACLIVGVYEDGKLTHSAKELDKATHGHISKTIKRDGFQAKLGHTLSIYHVAGGSYESIMLVGCGQEGKLDPTRFHRLVNAAARALKNTKNEKAVCYLGELKVGDESLAWKFKHITEVVKDAFYRFDKYKSEREPVAALREFAIYLADAKHQKACAQALKQGIAIAAGVTLAKDLANTPSNICTPTYIADQAKALAKGYSSLSINILNEAQMKKLGMGALLGVSQGSEQEAKFICLEYKGANKKSAPVALIGKGVTFDTGGNSLKPPDSMVGMKYDMCGAASVLGTIKAAAELDLGVNVVGIIPAVENMPGGSAYKPEDILNSLSGQTIEVISTDAEGRLILADALTYAQRYKPDAVIDIATLTGAVVIALGYHATGLLTNYEPLARELLAAGLESHDRAWQLPMWDEYQEQIASPFADMANTGGRAAGTITAGCFLSRFAKDMHWVHLDVAGTAAMMSGTKDRMATGRPVPMLVQYLINRSD